MSSPLNTYSALVNTATLFKTNQIAQVLESQPSAQQIQAFARSQMFALGQDLRKCEPGTGLSFLNSCIASCKMESWQPRWFSHEKATYDEYLAVAAMADEGVQAFARSPHVGFATGLQIVAYMEIHRCLAVLRKEAWKRASARHAACLSGLKSLGEAAGLIAGSSLTQTMVGVVAIASLVPIWIYLNGWLWLTVSLVAPFVLLVGGLKLLGGRIAKEEQAAKSKAESKRQAFAQAYLDRLSLAMEQATTLKAQIEEQKPEDPTEKEQVAAKPVFNRDVKICDKMSKDGIVDAAVRALVGTGVNYTALKFPLPRTIYDELARLEKEFAELKKEIRAFMVTISAAVGWRSQARHRNAPRLR